jgi:hypothetical protein
VTTVESEWDDDEQALMMALALYRGRLCPRGHHLPDTTSPEAEDRYDASSPVRCHACTALSRAAAQAKDNDHPDALLFTAERR